MKVSFEDEDMGLDAIIEGITGLGGQTVYIGSDNEEDAKKLRFAEFGTKDAPARPVLGPAFDSSRGALNAAIEKTYGSQIDAKSSNMRAVLETAGKVGLRAAQNVIQTKSAPPLDADTVEEKGNSKPLEETGSMLRSLAYEVD